MKKGALTFLILLPISLMAQPDKKVTEDFLQSFVDAFNAHDIAGIMSLMTDDCVFEASAGPDFARLPRRTSPPRQSGRMTAGVRWTVRRGG